MVIANAENYVVVNGLLFRLVKQKKIFDTSMKCLLVIPEKIENRYFTCFMIPHLVHIMVLSTCITLSKTDTGYTTCLKNYKGIYPFVKHVNNRSRKEVGFLIFIQGFLLVTIP